MPLRHWRPNATQRLLPATGRAGPAKPAAPHLRRRLRHGMLVRQARPSRAQGPCRKAGQRLLRPVLHRQKDGARHLRQHRRPRRRPLHRAGLPRPPPRKRRLPRHHRAGAPPTLRPPPVPLPRGVSPRRHRPSLHPNGPARSHRRRLLPRTTSGASSRSPTWWTGRAAALAGRQPLLLRLSPRLNPRLHARNRYRSRPLPKPRRLRPPPLHPHLPLRPRPGLARWPNLPA